MVEPFAAVIINSMLPGRQVFKKSTSLSSIARVVTSTTRPSMVSNFFTPVPRTAKGKEKAVDYGDNVYAAPVSQCQEWSCCVRHSIWCAGNRVDMLQELVPVEERIPTRRREQSYRQRYRSLRHRSLTSGNHGGQRRHASSISSNPSEAGPSSSSTSYRDVANEWREEQHLEQSSPLQVSESLTAIRGSVDHEPPDLEFPQEEEHASRLGAKVTDPELEEGHAISPQDQQTPMHTPHDITRPPDITAHMELFGQFIRSQTFDLESGWDVYSTVSQSGDLELVPSKVLLQFVAHMVAGVEQLSKGNFPTTDVHGWASRIKDILEDSSLSERSLPAHVVWRQCLIGRVAAVLDDVSGATLVLRTAQRGVAGRHDEEALLSLYSAVFLTIARNKDDEAVLTFLMQEWPVIGSRLAEWVPPWSKTKGQPKEAFILTVRNVMLNIRDPVRSFDILRGRDDTIRSSIGNLLIDTLIGAGLARDAYALLLKLRKQNLSIPLDLQCELVKTLVKRGPLESAVALFASITPQPTLRIYLSTGLILNSHLGDTVRTEEFYNSLVESNLATKRDVAMLMYAYAKQGRTAHVTTLFDDFFPKLDSGLRENNPTIFHYSVVIYGHAQRADFEGMNAWLEEMAMAGLKPNSYIFSTVLKSFALRGDLNSISAVLQQMRAAGVFPNAVVYTIVITLLAHRKDPVGAEAVYKRAVAEGVQPDRVMVTSLMNAHVEAGSWKGVIRVFDYLKTTNLRRLKLTVEVYNTLMKAYVFIGAPFRIVADLFSRLLQSSVIPDSYTYALLIQSACDAGKMDVASDIFWEMDTLGQSRPASGLVNAYTLTILMAGFLRKGDKVRAKAVYDEMNERGIQPTSITFGRILRAYGYEKTEESMQIAEAFVKSLMEGPAENRLWEHHAHGRDSALAQIYGPLLDAYAKMKQVEDVERLFHDMLKAGGEPSLGILANVLDAYRRTFNIDRILELWPQIFDLGLRYAKADSLFEGSDFDITRSRLQSNILCIPLSIYIDALSAAGLHAAIAEVWKRFQVHGFSFDSHNWNHMAVALIRAGEPARAFEVLERVIIPYQLQSEKLRGAREPSPSSPLSFDEPAEPETLVEEALSKPPLRHTKRRRVTVRIATARLANNAQLDEELEGGDFAHPLHVLHQVAPSWNIWRPHNATLAVLLLVIHRLQSGSIIQAVKPRTEADADDEIDRDEEEMERGRELSQQMLIMIETKYPKTLAAVLDFERTEMLRLGDKYQSTYNWR
ncbi:hypothetical protein BDQ12DRAFT_675515 [Crucibulum laeve]|uniref:PROP1-like PPR domain-containing protein n=1 Tax=Crucibulum laeve TaxID=68775 RepID=A0A5C3MHA9_9AGAR|nr:hypothetical protein BDQ12DRAFT_675515 [Crucibulum laeve]